MQDLEEIRAEYPDWQIDAAWVAAATGPDYCHYWARRGEVLLTDRTLRVLCMKIKNEDPKVYGS